MKALFTRKTVVIVSVAMLIVAITIVSVNVFGNRGPVTSIANFASEPFRALASSVARAFESIYGNIYKYDRLVEDYEMLQMRYAELRENNRDATDLAEENVRLRALLDFRERRTGDVYEEALVVSPGSSNWSSSFIINKGSRNSDTLVKVGDSVITQYGMLVGRISDVGDTTSTVISVLDTTFSAAVYVGAGAGAATAKGDFTMMGQGFLIIDHFEDDVPILPGDEVMTSGLGGRVPAGLVVGRVEQVFGHSTGIGRYATVRPLISLETVSYLYVITDYYTAETFD
jgi:rod shape-determining protein MreC